MRIGIVSAEDASRYRSSVYFRLLEQGVPFDDLRRALTGDSVSSTLSGWPKITLWPTLRPSPFAVVRKWAYGWSPVAWSAQLSFSLTRFSMAVFKSPSLGPSLRNMRPPRPLVLLVCRGINIVNSVSTKEISAALRLGRIDCFGGDSEELFSCGTILSLVDEEDTEDAEARKKENERRLSEDFSLKCRLWLAMVNVSQRQMFLQLSVAPLSLSWDEVRALSLCSECSYLD